MSIGCYPNIAPSKIIQYLKGRSSKLIQDEFPEILGATFMARGYFCATVGSVTEETIKRYIESQELSIDTIYLVFTCLLQYIISTFTLI